jgi:hypothetical protein
MAEMTQVEGKRVSIDRSAEDVWSFLIDIANMPKWEDSHAEWKQTSAGPIDRGTTFQSSVRFLGLEVKFGKGTKISYVLASVEGNKTKLSRVTEVHFHGLAKLLQPFAAPVTRWTGGMEANNVKRIVESEH